MLVFIPRAFFPDRPLPLGELFVETFYPGVRDEGGGYGFFILQEGYWSFGIVGVFAFMFLYGWCTNKIYQLFTKYRNFDIVVLWYASIYSVMVIAAVRSGILISLKTILMNSLPFILYLKLPYIMTGTNKLRHKVLTIGRHSA
jgi:oligosaccharide repeat unit polymerase